MKNMIYSRIYFPLFCCKCFIPPKRSYILIFFILIAVDDLCRAWFATFLLFVVGLRFLVLRKRCNVNARICIWKLELQSTDVTDCRPPTVKLYQIIGFVQFRENKIQEEELKTNGFGNDVHMGCLDFFYQEGLKMSVRSTYFYEFSAIGSNLVQLFFHVTLICLIILM